jgi:hypothetical protein
VSSQPAYPIPPLLPDVELIVSQWLRQSPAIRAICEERVFTSFPPQLDRELSFVLLHRFGGTPPFSQPLVLDGAQLQISAYGGPKKTAHRLAATIRAVLCSLQETEHEGGRVTVVDFGPLRSVPDDVFVPPRERYILDAEVYVRATVVPVAENVSLVRGKE